MMAATDGLIGRWAGGRGRELALVLPVLAVAGAISLGSVLLAPTIAFAPLTLLALVVAGLAAWLVLAAACGSPSAMCLYLAALAFLIDAQFRVRGAGDIAADWQSMLKFAIWMGAGVIGAPHMPSLRRLLARPISAAWLAYITVALFSSLYSPAAGYSFGCSLALLCLFAFAFALTKHLTEAQLLWTIAITLTLFNVASWAVFYAIPDLGTSEAWTTSGLMLRMCGLAGQATNLGQVCAIAIGVIFTLWYTGRCSLLTAMVLGGFAFATLIKSDARTTEIAAVAGIGLVFASRSMRLIAGGALGGACALLLLQIFPKLLATLGAGFSRSGDPSEIYTLTGRLEIWDFAWRQIRLSPVFGYGYNSSKVVLGSHIGFQNGLMVDSAHNLYLQNLLSVGALGMAPLVFLLVWLCVRCITRPQPLVLYTLAVVLISSVSDTDSIGTTPSLLTVLFFIISVWPDSARSEGAQPAQAGRSAIRATAPAWGK